MKAALMLVAAAIACGPVFSKGSHRVKGYTKKDGTYVAPHNKTNPDKSKGNNYSSKGNVNPNTGKEGTVDPGKP